MLPTRPLRRHYWFPVLFVLFIAGILFFVNERKKEAIAIVSLVLPLLAVVVIGGWAALMLPRTRERRFRTIKVYAATIVLISLALSQIVRYEGSYDGSALPKLSWIWSKKLPVKLEAFPTAPPATLAVDELDKNPPGLKDWPQFMGPGRDGLTAEITWNPDWNSHPPKQLWRRAVGLGWSGMSVAGSRLVTQEQRGEEEMTACYHAMTGEPLWSHAENAKFAEPMGGIGPRATPTIDAAEKRVYVMGATGILQCLNLANGQLIWKQATLPAGKGENLTWGQSGSPLLAGPLVIVSGGPKPPALRAYNRATGKLVWAEGNDGGSYGAPVLYKIGNVDQIVHVNGVTITSHDSVTGRVLWSHSWPGATNKIAQPLLVAPDKLLVTASYSLGSFLIEVKPNAAGAWETRELWKSKEFRTKFSSGTVIGDYVYGLDEAKFACVELATGKRKWRDGAYGFGQQIGVGSYLLVQSEFGPVKLVKANPETLEEAGQIDALSDATKTWNPPTLAGRYLFVRNDQEMAAYELQSNGGVPGR